MTYGDGSVYKALAIKYEDQNLNSQKSQADMTAVSNSSIWETETEHP